IYTPGFSDASAVKGLVKLTLPADVTYGSAVIVDSAAGYRYIYGFKPDWIINRPLVARSAINKKIEEPWEFYTGTSWSANANDAAPILAAATDYVSPSF